jgi:hypothetical protein
VLRPDGTVIGRAGALGGGKALSVARVPGCLLGVSYRIGEMPERLRVACVDVARGQVRWERRVEQRGVIAVRIEPRRGHTLVFAAQSGPSFLWAFGEDGSLKLEHRPPGEPSEHLALPAPLTGPEASQRPSHSARGLR